MFKIISAGWQCANWMEQTLSSVRCQSVEDWQHAIVYDKSTDDGADLLKAWTSQDPRYLCLLNEQQNFAVHNQYTGIKMMDPQDDDIIVFLDLDGDRLAHSYVLEHVARAYEDDTLLTYGNYFTPAHAGQLNVRPFPKHVVVENSYRNFMLSPERAASFNHLRTMKGKVFNSIPEDHFKWEDGSWYTIGTDYIFMVPALERAGGRYKCIEEVLLLYNHDNPYADYRINPGEDCVQNMLHRPPLEALP